jgi:hypothetical protein
MTVVIAKVAMMKKMKTKNKKDTEKLYSVLIIKTTNSMTKRRRA